MCVCVRPKWCARVPWTNGQWAQSSADQTSAVPLSKRMAIVPLARTSNTRTFFGGEWFGPCR